MILNVKLSKTKYFHSLHEYIKKIISMEVCEMQTVSYLECSGCDTFWIEDKKQFNLNYLATKQFHEIFVADLQAS